MVLSCPPAEHVLALAGSLLAHLTDCTLAPEGGAEGSAAARKKSKGAAAAKAAAAKATKRRRNPVAADGGDADDVEVRLQRLYITGTT